MRWSVALVFPVQQIDGGANRGILKPPDFAGLSFEPESGPALSGGDGADAASGPVLEGVVVIALAVSRGGLDGACSGGLRSDVRRFVRRRAGRHRAGPRHRLGSRAL